MLGTPGFEQRDPMCNKQWLNVTYKKIHHWKSSYKLSGNEVALVLYRLAAEFCRNRFELEKTEAAVLKGLICETWEQEDSWDEFANTTGRTWALRAAPFACWFVLTRPLPAASLIGWVFWNISIPAEVMIGPVWRKYYMLHVKNRCLVSRFVNLCPEIQWLFKEFYINGHMKRTRKPEKSIILQDFYDGYKLSSLSYLAPNEKHNALTEELIKKRVFSNIWNGGVTKSNAN